MPSWARSEASDLSGGQWFSSMETYDSVLSPDKKRRAFYTALINIRGDLFDNFETIADMRNFVDKLKSAESGSLSGYEGQILDKIIVALQLQKLPTDKQSICSLMEEAIKYYER